MKRFFIWLVTMSGLIALILWLIGSSADWGAPDYTRGLIVVSVFMVLATGFSFRTRESSPAGGGAMTDAIGPGSAAGSPAGIEMKVDDDITHEQGRYQEARSVGPNIAPPPFPLMLATTVLTAAAALISWQVFE